MIYDRYAEITQKEQPPVTDYDYIVHNGFYDSRDNAHEAANDAKTVLGANGKPMFPGAYVSTNNGCYYAKCVVNNNIEYAMRNAEILRTKTHRDSGIYIR